MPFQRHGFQAFGHVGFVHPLQMDGRVGLFQDQLRHPPQVGPRRIAQVGQWLPGAARQAEQRLAIGVGLAVGRQHFLPQADHFVAVGIQLKGLG